MIKKVLNFSEENDGLGNENNTPTEETNQSNEPSRSSPTETAEEMRQRRLNRFATKPSTPSTTVIDNKPKTTVFQTPTQSPTKSIDIPKKSTNDTLNISSPIKSPIKSPEKSPGRSPGDITKWEHLYISKILKVTTIQEKVSSGIYYLNYLVKDLESQGETETKLSTQLLDRILVEQLTYNENCYQAPFGYLLNCINNIHTESRKIKMTPIRTKIVESVEEMLFNYCELITCNPDLFQVSDEKTSIDEFYDALIQRTLPPRFIDTFISNLKKSNKISQVFEPLFEILRQKSLKASIDDSSASDIVGIFCDLMGYNEIASIIINSDKWLASSTSTGKIIEIETYLGRLLSFGCIPTTQSAAVATKHFSDPANMSNNDLLGLGKSFRLKINTIVKSIYSCLLNLIKNLKQNDLGKEAWLSWVAQALESNTELLKYRVDVEKVSGMAMLFNICLVCFAFCKPIIDQGSKAVSLIYYVHLHCKKKIEKNSLHFS